MTYKLTFLFLCLLKGYESTPILSPEHVDVIENESIKLTCSVSLPGTTFQWTNTSTVWSRIDCYNNKSYKIFTGFLSEGKHLYAFYCFGNGSFTLEILRAAARQNGQVWQCKNVFETSNKVTINVKVPVKIVTLQEPNHNYMQENQSQSITCNSSTGRPDPTVKWFVRNPRENMKYQLTQLSSNIIIPGDYDLNAVVSTLNFKPNRTINEWRLYCEVWTRTSGADVTSKEISVNVSYPPEHLPIIHGIDTNNNVSVIESDSGKLICSITGGNPPASLRWNCFGSTNMTCDIYENNRVTSTVNWKANRYQNKCSCTSEHIDNWKRIINVTFNVQYPPEKPAIKIGHVIIVDEVRVMKNKSLHVICESKSNPFSNYSWTGPGTSGKVGDTLNISSVKIMDQGEYKCQATNTMKRMDNSYIVGSNASSFNLTTLYFSGTPTFRFESMEGQVIEANNLNVVRNDAFSIYCEVKGNPTPNVTWDTGHQGPNLNISPVYSDINRTCTATNLMRETASELETRSMSTNSLFIEVFYPPSIPTINISNKNDNITVHDESVSVIESETILLTCFSNSKPLPTYAWDGVRSTNTHVTNILEFQNISRNDTGTYTCKVGNVMRRSFGKIEEGKNKSTIILNILYPATIMPIEDRSITEGSQLSMACPFINGNPPNFTTWSRSTDQRLWNQTLYIQNVSRADDTVYSCSAITEMFPTIGSSVRVERKKSFHLNVFFPSEIKQFSVSSLEQIVAINNTENASITCNAEANPPSDLSIKGPMGDIVLEVSKRNTVHHTIHNASYINAGEYICTGRNNYTSRLPSSSKLILIVRAQPRPSSDDTSVKKVATTLHKDAELQFVAWNYLDKPNKTVFNWFKENVSIHANDSKYMIHSNELQTKITIRNTTQQDLGLYKLNVKNSIGTYTQFYELKATAALSSETDSQRKNNSSIIAGSISSAVVVVVAVIIGAVFFLRKRQKKGIDSLYQNVPFFGQTSNRKCEPKSEAKKKIRNCPTDETTFGGMSSKRELNNIDEKKKYITETDDDTFEGLQEVDDLPIILHERTEYCNSQDKIDKIDRITVAELYAYVFGNDDNLEAEYQKLPTGLQNPCTFARKPENIALNRYNGIYPYDHSRVKISDQPDFFINACYIDGYRKRKAYIASLGPTSKTTSDFKTFWQMVWHERSDMIVMLTNLHEPSGMKCEKYWPHEGTSQQYGDVTIISKTFEAFAEYTVRTFGVSKGKEQRLLTHLHYTAWPDKTVPEDVTSLLDLRKRMQDVPIIQNGPIVIHCSAGIGRTGTLIALDILIEEGLDKNSVNVFECVYNLRKQRVKMVQTLEQYKYIHKCLVNALSFDGETVSKERIHEHFENKNDQQYSTLFQKLELTVETDNKSEQKARLKNMKNSSKNRQEADVPGDRFIVFLNLTDGKEGSEYINAVYVNSFKRKDHFIVAQSPLPNTITDFVSMIYQEDCSCIATMEDLKEPGMTVGTYLPEMNKKAIFGNFQVSSSKLEETSAYIIRKMKIKYTDKNANGEKCFYHFQYKNWTTGSKTPGNVADFVQFISEVEVYANELGEDSSRVVVHCLKANERSCLFCAVAIIIEKLKVEGKVNILNVIRHLRTRRKTAIVSKEQLKFCYEAASAYVNQNKY